MRKDKKEEISQEISLSCLTISIHVLCQQIHKDIPFHTLTWCRCHFKKSLYLFYLGHSREIMLILKNLWMLIIVVELPRWNRSVIMIDLHTSDKLARPLSSPNPLGLERGRVGSCHLRWQPGILYLTKILLDNIQYFRFIWLTQILSVWFSEWRLKRQSH